MIDYKNAILKIGGLLVILIAILLAIWLGVYFWPFLIGGLVAIMAEPIIRKMMTKLKMSRKVAGFIVIIVIYLILALIVFMGVFKLTKEAISITTELPNIYNKIVENSQNTFNEIIKIYDNLPEGIASKVYEVMMNMINGVGAWTSTLMDKVINFAMFIPNVMIYIGVTFLSSLFIAMDRRTITTFLQDNFPKKWVKNILNLIQVSMGSLVNYLRAEMILASITFIQLFIAFIILKQPYSLTLALAISLVDALPILRYWNSNDTLGYLLCYYRQYISRYWVNDSIYYYNNSKTAHRA